jgi:hypothetical protein
MRTLLYSTIMFSAVMAATSGTATAGCDTIIVNGEKRVICSPDPAPPVCRGPACPSKPTK